MTNHMKNPPPAVILGVAFKLKTARYHLSHSDDYFNLRRIDNGIVRDKCELRSKDKSSIWNYLASGERCTETEARRAYEDAKAMD